jgi:hypothetical protein
MVAEAKKRSEPQEGKKAERLFVLCGRESTLKGETPRAGPA